MSPPQYAREWLATQVAVNDACEDTAGVMCHREKLPTGSPVDSESVSVKWGSHVCIACLRELRKQRDKHVPEKSGSGRGCSST